jgi:hypothetical protein
MKSIILVLLLAAVAGSTGLACSRDEPPPTRDSPAESRPAEGPSGTLFLRHVWSPSITRIDLASGRTVTASFSELAGGDPPYNMVRAGEELVVYGGGRTYAIDPGLEDPPRDLGESWYFVPSATEGRVWLMSLDPESPETVRDLAAVREVTLDGRVSVKGAGRPPSTGPSILAAVRGGLVFQDGSRLRVWNPETGEVTAHLGGAFPAATYGDFIAWCADGCPELHLTNTATGEDTVVRPDASFAFEETYDAAFSPDGSLLAVPVVSDGRRLVALVDVKLGSASVIAGSELASDYPALAWHPSGDWLLLSAGDGRLLAAPADGGPAVSLDVRAPAAFVDMAAG